MSALQNWSKLNKLQVGKYAEYFVKMAFTGRGFYVYTPEIDDQGIDFVIRLGSEKNTVPPKYFEIQVKALRDGGYTFMQTEKFEIAENLYLALVILTDGVEPELYLIPSTVWSEPNGPFTHRKYEGKKSKPEYGMTVNKKWADVLKEYTFSQIVETLGK